MLHRTFEETDGYDEIVLLRDIRFESFCEHHLAPIIGKAHVAYLPSTRVIGISKLARLIEIFAKRMQIQEKLTAQIANTLDEVLQPKGVAGRDRGAASMHDHARHPQAGCQHGDEPAARGVPLEPGHAPRVPRDGQLDRPERRRLGAVIAVCP